MALTLAIDLGKYNSVFRGFSGSTGEVDIATVKTTPALMPRRSVSRVVIEARSQAGWVHDLCGELGLTCEAASTAGETCAATQKSDRVAEAVGRSAGLRSEPAAGSVCQSGPECT